MIPPGGWHYIQGDVRLERNTHAELVKAVESYRAENNLPQGDVVGDVNSYICGNWPHFCHGADSVSVTSYLTPTKATQLMADVQSWARMVLSSTSAHPLVLDELAEVRAQTCAQCVENLNWRSACASCVASVDRLSASIRQGRDTKTSANLGGCNVMRHDNRSAVFMDRDSLHKSNQVPDNCWVNVIA
jgi:hypothetical protein